MALWLKVDLDLFDHPKVWTVADALGVTSDDVWPKLILLWSHSMKYYPDGDISGLLSKPGELSRVVKLKTSKATAFIEAVESAGLLERIDNRLIIHDWETQGGGQLIRARRKDAARKSKNIQSDSNGNPMELHRTSDGTPTRDEREREIERENRVEKTPLPPVGGTPACPYDSIKTAYNEICGAAGLTRCNEIDPDSARGRHVKTLWRRLGDQDKVRALFTTAAASDLLRGVNERGWIANFDFVVKPANVIKIEEGAYKAKPKRSQWAIQEPSNQGMPVEADLSEFLSPEGKLL